MKEENGHLFFDNKKEFDKWLHKLDPNTRVAYVGISNSYDNYQWYLINGNLSCYLPIEKPAKKFKLSLDAKVIIFIVICIIIAIIFDTFVMLTNLIVN